MHKGNQQTCIVEIGDEDGAEATDTTTGDVCLCVIPQRERIIWARMLDDIEVQRYVGFNTCLPCLRKNLHIHWSRSDASNSLTVVAEMVKAMHGQHIGKGQTVDIYALFAQGEQDVNKSFESVSEENLDWQDSSNTLCSFERH